MCELVCVFERERESQGIQISRYVVFCLVHTEHPILFISTCVFVRVCMCGWNVISDVEMRKLYLLPPEKCCLMCTAILVKMRYGYACIANVRIYVCMPIGFVVPYIMHTWLLVYNMNRSWLR